MIRQAGRQSGVTLMEALVALVVMAIGAASVVGMQGSLRMNGDVAKQRAEAVRLAQQPMEDFRGFVGIAADGAKTDWGDIASSSAETIAGANATYQRTVAVTSSSGDNPRSKAVHVAVTWQDRASQPQGVAVNSLVAGVPPELGGSLSIPANQGAFRNPGGRHPGIPPAAVDQGDGTSHFSPPGTSGVAWVFNNASGVITSICTGFTCSAVDARLVSGFVRFATGATQPTAAQAEAPPSAAFALSMFVLRTAPSLLTVPCTTYLHAQYVEYYCAVDVSSSSDNPKTWSGRTMMGSPSPTPTSLGGQPLASSIADASAGAYRVCRYTPYRDNSLVPPTGITNAEHPFNYAGVSDALTNQNFLVIKAGDGTTAFTCPDDDTSTPNVLGTTWQHQPSS